MTRKYNPSGWYRTRNEKIYAQAEFMGVRWIADYWKLTTEHVRYILNRETKKRAHD
jgi:Mor family transcriptional regulator